MKSRLRKIQVKLLLHCVNYRCYGNIDRTKLSIFRKLNPKPMTVVHITSIRQEEDSLKAD